MMKTKLLFLVVLIAAVVFSCQKKDSEPAQQDVVFSVAQIDDGLKSTNEVPDCDPTLEPVYAHVKIKDINDVIKDYYPLVFRLDGKLYSQAIKLDPGTYTVTQFLVMDDMGDGQGANDEVYMATPETGSTFAEYVTPTVPFNFTVTAFTKIEIDVEVLCFLEKDYIDFGFFWFNITEIIVREQCFFGDICLKHWSDYAGSHYDLQPGELGLDMVAIMHIQVYKNNVFVEAFTNDVAPNYGVGAPLCVTYADELGVVDNFTFVLYILVKQGDQFNFVPFHTWNFSDAEMIGAGDDGVVDFVLGSCNLSGTDLQLIPYQNLPATCDLVVGNAAPGSQGTYFDVTLSNIGPGYDIWNGVWGVYCGDQETNITGGSSHPGIGVYGSLMPQLLPAFVEQQLKDNLDQANWLMNHLGDYTGETWQDVQNALWIILDQNVVFPGSLGSPSALALQMAADAALYGNNYVPLPGGWAAVLFIDDPDVQIIFTIVDP